MTTRMLINATVADELRVAIVQDGELIDLDIEAAEASSIRGNIYKGVVHNVEGSLAAAFVNFGEHKQGFLPFSEIAPSSFYREWNKKEEPKITDVIKKGQDIIVQVSKDAIGEKGAALTTYLSLAGRYTVLMPGTDARGVSRKIEDDKERKKIKAIAEKIDVPEGCGYIIRTAGLGQTKTALQRDLERLGEVYDRIKKSAEIARAPSVLHGESDLVGRTLRDLFTEAIDEIWIDSSSEYEQARTYFEELMPQYLDRLMHYQNPIPIFSYYRVEEQIEETFDRRVPLPSGGSIVIDETEALVAIDVNSGKMTSEGGHEETVYKTNFEAAQVAARQLRLRDLGGIVVIDFIDMELSRNNRAVEKALRDAMKGDKARVKLSRILSNGLCIVTRQRIRQGLQKSFRRRCPACEGTGWIRTPESHALSLLKRIEARVAQGGVQEVRVTTHRTSAEHILNHKRSELSALEREYDVRVLITARPDVEHGRDLVTFLSKGELLAEITDQLPSREDRRRASLKKKKKRSTKSEAEAAQIAVSAEEAKEGKDGSDGKKRRRRRGNKEDEGRRTEPKRETREGRAERPERAERAERPERAERTERPERAERAGRPARAERVRAERPDRSERSAPQETRESANGNGPTFTGRPTPEVMARIRAEAEARRMARAQRQTGRADGDGTSDRESSPSPRGEKPTPSEDSPGRFWSSPMARKPEDLGPEVPEARTTSLLQRLLGARRGSAPPQVDKES